jgi:hypothetical protein
LLQLGDAGGGAVFVLLSGAAADTAGAIDDAIAYDRNRPLAHDYMAASAAATPRGVGWSARSAISPLGRPNAAEATALDRIGARPYRIVHALKCDRPAAAIADRGAADLDVQLLCFCQGAP